LITMNTWVLIRGLTREQAHWGDFGRELALALPGARVVAVDLPGAGVLRQQPVSLRVQAMVEACRQQLREAGVAPPYSLLGLSLGGMVAAEWCRLWPHEVRCCVLVNTSMRPYSPPQRRLNLALLPQMLRVLFDSDTGRAERAVLQLTSADPARHRAVLQQWQHIRQQRPVARANALRQLLAAALYRWPGGAPVVPVLVVCSAADALVSPDCSRLIAQAWGAPLATHASAGHDLPLDAGGWLAAEVARWCASGNLV